MERTKETDICIIYHMVVTFWGGFLILRQSHASNKPVRTPAWPAHMGAGGLSRALPLWSSVPPARPEGRGGRGRWDCAWLGLEAFPIGVFFGCFARKIDGPGLPRGSIIYQGHLCPLKGHLCSNHPPKSTLERPKPVWS